MSQNENRRLPSDLPSATVEKSWRTYLIWLAPLAALGFAGWLVYTTLLATGPTLHILFSNAQDMDPNNAQVKYRGAVVGTVKSAHLTKDQQNVDVEVSRTNAPVIGSCQTCALPRSMGN